MTRRVGQYHSGSRSAVCLALALAACTTGDRKSESAPESASEPASANATATATADLWLGGDVHIDGRPRGDTPGNTPDVFDRLAPLAGYIDGAIGIINLEGPVGTGESRKEMLYNAAQALPGLAARGVRVATIVNNHTLDRGADGIARTLAALDRAGIAPAGRVPGGDRDARDKHGVAVIDTGRAGVAGVRIGVVGHDLSGVRGDPALTGIREAITDAIAHARQRADVVVVGFHTRGPPSYVPARELEAAVELALTAGADVIAAHGSHALARVERRGKQVIAWGLGNLVFDCPCTREGDSAIVRVTVDHRGVTDARVIPVDAGLHGQPARPAREASLTLDLLEVLGSALGARGDGDASF